MGEKAIAFTTCETYHAMRVRICEFKSMAIALKILLKYLLKSIDIPMFQQIKVKLRLPQDEFSY